jgi:hypothetical protein
MYIGPWQEYLLARLLAERNKQEHQSLPSSAAVAATSAIGAGTAPRPGRRHQQDSSHTHAHAHAHAHTHTHTHTHTHKYHARPKLPTIIGGTAHSMHDLRTSSYNHSHTRRDGHRHRHGGTHAAARESVSLPNISQSQSQSQCLSQSRSSSIRDLSSLASTASQSVYSLVQDALRPVQQAAREYHQKSVQKRIRRKQRQQQQQQRKRERHRHRGDGHNNKYDPTQSKSHSRRRRDSHLDKLRQLYAQGKQEQLQQTDSGWMRAGQDLSNSQSNQSVYSQSSAASVLPSYPSIDDPCLDGHDYYNSSMTAAAQEQQNFTSAQKSSVLPPIPSTAAAVAAAATTMSYNDIMPVPKTPKGDEVDGLLGWALGLGDDPLKDTFHSLEIGPELK